jgi:hypothetical protein
MHPETDKNLHTSAGRPNKLITKFSLRTPVFGKQEIVIPIRDDDDRPLWLVHPNTSATNKRIDVVAIPLKLSEGEKRLVAVYPINELANARLLITVGMEVFIIGYPFGSRPPAIPVWKRGSIASEPDLVRITDGYYLIDTASRPGMSGAPVILRSWTNRMTEPGMMALAGDQPFDRFIGVYSGRLPAELGEAQIGMVWHEAFINEIIDAGKVDE